MNNKYTKKNIYNNSKDKKIEKLKLENFFYIFF